MPDTAETPPTPDPEPVSEAPGTALEADLAAERGAREDLANQLEQLKTGLAAALGIETEQATPEQLTEQLGTAQTEARTARAQLAIYQAAPQGVDIPALLDSRAFQDTLGGLDPTDTKALTAAVNDFVTANPRFKTSTTPPGLHDAHAGGTPPPGSPGLNQLLRAAAGR